MLSINPGQSIRRVELHEQYGGRRHEATASVGLEPGRVRLPAIPITRQTRMGEWIKRAKRRTSGRLADLGLPASCSLAVWRHCFTCWWPCQCR